MSEMKKLKFCELTKLVTINWIENNYQGEAIYPLALKYITATFIETIVEQWKKSSDFIVVSNSLTTREQTATQTSTLQWGSIINGSIKVLTDTQAYHRWHLKINKIHREMLVGLDEISGNRKYRSSMYRKNKYAHPFDTKGNHIIENEKCYDPSIMHAHIIKGDRIIIALSGTSLKISIIRNGGYQTKFEHEIHPGDYQLGVTLFNHGDSITICNMNSSYNLPYRDDGCNACGSDIRPNWSYCPRCKTPTSLN